MIKYVKMIDTPIYLSTLETAVILSTKNPTLYNSAIWKPIAINVCVFYALRHTIDAHTAM